VTALDIEGWDRTLAVNLRAPYLLSKAAFPRMREAGGGTIVNISSVAGKKGRANASAYCASKFGLTGLTEALADEGKGYGIRARSSGTRCIWNGYEDVVPTYGGWWSHGGARDRAARGERKSRQRRPCRSALG
jgi:NAD(P)-dependent dehydrogenase (short-subunit alcohol dehydrogenase family)